jgi:protein ImuA
MSLLRAKKAIVEQLRRRVGGIEASCTSPTALPAPGAWVSPAIFTSGLQEMIGDTPANFTAATAFALIVAGQDKSNARPLFFTTLASDRQERGQLYSHGVHQLGLDPNRMLLLEARSEKELLWAAEEAANCDALGGIIVALGRREKLYGFAASRRLKLRQEVSGVPLTLVRAMTGEPTAATARWRVVYAPSAGTNAAGAPMPLLGLPRFRVVLEHYAGWPAQGWTLELDETYGLHVVALPCDQPADTHGIERNCVA